MVNKVALSGFARKSDFSVQPLRTLCLCGCFSLAILNHRGTEYTEVAQRRARITTFRARPLYPVNHVNPVQKTHEKIFIDDLIGTVRGSMLGAGAAGDEAGGSFARGDSY